VIERVADEPADDLVVVSYVQDADSFGWSIAALIHSAYKPGRPRWGVLDALCSTGVGASLEAARDPSSRGARDAVRRLWHLVDWYEDEVASRVAFEELRSRIW